MSKYTNALYPDKINDLVDNDGNVNPSAVKSGTQLYKHTLGVETSDGETVCYVISTNPKSLARKVVYKVYDPDWCYISAVVDVYGDGEVLAPVLMFTHESEPSIIHCYDSVSNIEVMTLASPYFLYDTITKL